MCKDDVVRDAAREVVSTHGPPQCQLTCNGYNIRRVCARSVKATHAGVTYAVVCGTHVALFQPRFCKRKSVIEIGYRIMARCIQHASLFGLVLDKSTTLLLVGLFAARQLWRRVLIEKIRLHAARLPIQTRREERHGAFNDGR